MSVTTPASPVDASGNTPAGIPQVNAFASLEGLLAELAARLDAGDFASIGKLTAPSTDASARVTFLKHLLTDCGWRVATANRWADAGTITGVNRRELKLESATPDSAKPAGAVMADIERIAGTGWK